MKKLMIRAALSFCASLCLARESENFLPQLISTVANFGPGCRVRLLVPQGAEFPVTYSEESGKGGASIMLRSLPSHYKQRQLQLGIVCYDSLTPNLNIDAPVRFDVGVQKWVTDYSGWMRSYGVDEKTRRHFMQGMRVYSLSMKNAQGYAYTEESKNGEERWRPRYLSYCVFHGAKALCGNGEVGLLADGPKGDLTPYVLKVLQSIEFVSDPVGRDAAAQTSSSQPVPGPPISPSAPSR